MNYTVKNKHIVTLLAAMAGLSTASVFAATFGSNLQDNNQIGTTYVSTQDGDTIRIGQLDTSYGGGAAPSSTVISPDIASGPSNTDYVYTSLNSVTPDKTTTLQGGLVVDPNTGNTTVAQGASQKASLSPNLIRVRRIEVYNQTEANPALWGQAVNPIGETQYGYVDTNGNFNQVALSPAAVSALDAFVNTPIAPNAADVFASLSPADIKALGSLYSPGTSNADTNTGRLAVEGALLVDGVTGTNGISNTGVIGTDSLVVDGITVTNGIANTGAISTDSLTIGGLTAATVADVSAEANTRAAADTAETNARIAADNAEAATRAAADTTLQANITAEAKTRADADTLLTTNLTKEVADRVAAVNTEKNRAVAAETALANRATALEGRVGRAEGRINSLRKGVSMAAALQTPVIEAGKQNAVKAGVATVDGAQGFGIAVARRINDSVQVNLDVATDFQTDTAARAGVNYSF